MDNSGLAIVDDQPITAAIDEVATHYISAATSESTQTAYQADIANFLKKGGALLVMNLTY